MFEWSDFATTQNRAELEEGIYSVITTDANGCSAELQNLVIENDCPSTSEITFVNPPLDIIVECDAIPTTFLPTARQPVQLQEYK